MTPFMKADILPLTDLLGGGYRFHLPPFQRSYVWDKADHAWQLVDDALQAMTDESKPPERRWHFLGHMMLQRPGAGPDVMVIDGHQRLMTVSIVFAVLRDLEDDKALRDRLARLIAEPVGPAADPLWRLTPQDGILAFFRDYVQVEGATRNPVPGAVDEHLDTSQRNLIEVRDHLTRRLGRMTRKARRQLADFLADRCIVNASEVEDEEDAWRVFTQTHTRGCKLEDTDTTKAFLLARTASDRVEEDSETWERLEAKLGRERLRLLLTMLQFGKERRIREYGDPLRLAQVWPKDVANGTFVRNVLAPAGNSAVQLLEPGLAPERPPNHIDEQAAYLRWIAKREPAWLVAALAWFEARYGHKREEAFFRALKAVSYTMLVTGEGAHDRRRFYIEIAKVLEENPDTAIERMKDVVRESRAEFAAMLSAANFFSKSYHKPVLYAIEARLSGSALDTEKKLLSLDHPCSVEHIYPRKPAADSQWLRDGPRLTRELDSIGNLLIVPARLNTETDRKGFTAKQEIFASSQLFRMVEAMGNSKIGPRFNKEQIAARTAEMVQLAMLALDIADG